MFIRQKALAFCAVWSTQQTTIFEWKHPLAFNPDIRITDYSHLRFAPFRFTLAIHVYSTKLLVQQHSSKTPLLSKM